MKDKAIYDYVTAGQNMSELRLIKDPLMLSSLNDNLVNPYSLIVILGEIVLL